MTGAPSFMILPHMKRVFVEVDDRTAAELERVVPAKSRKRSEFIRWALRRALWDDEEQTTRHAYLQISDNEGAASFDSATWTLARKTRRATR